MRRAGILSSQRGAEGGYWLSRPASDISVADVIRPLDGPLAEVRGLRPEAATYEGAAEHLQAVWVAVRGQSAFRPRVRHHRRHRLGQAAPIRGEADRRPRGLALTLSHPCPGCPLSLPVDARAGRPG